MENEIGILLKYNKKKKRNRKDKSRKSRCTIITVIASRDREYNLDIFYHICS